MLELRLNQYDILDSLDRLVGHYFSGSELAEDIGCSTEAIRTRASELVKLGLVFRTTKEGPDGRPMRGHPYVYTLTRRGFQQLHHGRHHGLI